MNKKKAIRKLYDFDFSGGKAHMALVGPVVGGPANGKETILLKSRLMSQSSLRKCSKFK